MNNKGVEAWLVTMLALVFAILTIILVFSVSSGAGQGLVQVINEKVLARLQVSPIPVPGIGGAPAEEAGLAAKIFAMPHSPQCPFQPVIVTAGNSRLPENETLDTVNCFWDLDIETDTNGDSILNNDDDSVNCDATTAAEPAFGNRTIRLSLVTSKGISDFATEKFNSTAFCACDTRPSCTATLGLKGNEVNTGDTLSINIEKNWDVEDLQIKVLPSADARLIIDVGADGVSDFASNVTSGKEFVVQGQQLETRISAIQAVCETSSCAVEMQVFINNGFVQILDADLPYNTKLF